MYAVKESWSSNKKKENQKLYSLGSTIMKRAHLQFDTVDKINIPRTLANRVTVHYAV